MAEGKFPPNTALISITDYGCQFAELQHEPSSLLRISFDDVDADVFVDELGRKPTEEERKQIEEKYHMFSDEQANRIARFFFETRDKCELLICQCEHGQSRSAAVASAIMEYTKRNGIRIFASDKYYPNKYVFRKTYRALRAEGKK